MKREYIYDFNISLPLNLNWHWMFFFLEKYGWEKQNTNYLKQKKEHLKSDKRPKERVNVIIKFTTTKSNYDQI